jgi:hypothetical protein
VILICELKTIFLEEERILELDIIVRILDLKQKLDTGVVVNGPVVNRIFKNNE